MQTLAFRHVRGLACHPLETNLVPWENAPNINKKIIFFHTRKLLRLPGPLTFNLFFLILPSLVVLLPQYSRWLKIESPFQKKIPSFKKVKKKEERDLAGRDKNESKVATINPMRVSFCCGISKHL